ncbi:MAG: hypothetical protein GY820_31240 [Gammaproteobacteria bacterium]|nr:hypothetical protein [Gammaproteobacteria bacterium]
MKKTIALIIVIVGGIFFLPAILRMPLISQTPEDALVDFYDTTGQAEDMLMDPLILAGEKVVPLVLQEISSPEMKLRRYAIHFLGNGQYQSSIPTLKAILGNEKEIDYIRGDALASIFNTNHELGMSLAKAYTSRSDYLGKQAVEIVTGKNGWWYQRTFWQALNNVHH